MQDFIVIEFRDPIKFMEGMNEKLEKGYIVISSGQYQDLSGKNIADSISDNH
ncbi:MAG: hypothetical protein HeimC2_38170 [Candidatus Heimdallarchaeota archaeon LC_2]|nr:MAG: hypothetical protein HeimC2_38170 [Candidatus Heimdallarchaeota archaeon LC_2]